MPPGQAGNTSLFRQIPGHLLADEPPSQGQWASPRGLRPARATRTYEDERDMSGSSARLKGLSRRSLLALAAAGTATTATQRALAQSPFSWLENLPGFGAGTRPPPSRDPSRVQEQLNDLRTDE